MRRPDTQRYIWLFLFAIAVPSVAVAWIGTSLIRQDQELEESRRSDEQRRMVDEVRRGLLDHVEGLKRRKPPLLSYGSGRGRFQSCYQRW